MASFRAASSYGATSCPFPTQPTSPPASFEPVSSDCLARVFQRSWLFGSARSCLAKSWAFASAAASAAALSVAVSSIFTRMCRELNWLNESSYAACRSASEIA